MKWWFVVLVVVASRVAYAHPEVTKPCVDCHPDSHKGELGTKCAGCHETNAWTPTTFGVERHTKYVLDGRHLATPCGGCHTGPRPRSFAVPSKECLDCHQNPHGTKFSKEMVDGGCGGCHTTGTWKAWKVDHRAWPLTGGHARTACLACHPGQSATAPVAAFRGVPRACERCHGDVHAGQFERKACTDCHTTGSFRAPFDHAKTRYPLEGIHVDMACSRCHPQQTLRNGDKAIRWRLGFAACSDCHVNRHRGVERPCGSCHESVNWKPVRNGGDFDHASVGFPLRGRHAKATCMGCHERGMRPATECQTCHTDEHRGRLAGACAECHTPTAWNDTRTFEQHRRTRMPLTGKHAVIECAECHRKQGERTWKDLPVDCVGCHSERYRAAVPDHDGAQPFSRDCALCHVTIAWTPAIDPSLLRTAGDHRAFALTGNHRVACASCHVDERRRGLVRCDGCHAPAKLRSQHRSPVAAAASACLRCHPRGARR